MPRTIIAGALLLAASLAHANPHVAYVSGGESTAETTVARVTLEAAAFDVVFLDDKRAPLRGEDVELANARQTLRRANEAARSSFIATQYADARDLINTAERQLASWAGEPAIARGLAELDLLAAQCGDAGAYAAAAAHDEALELDAAIYSPDVQHSYARAVADRARVRRVHVHVNAPGGTVFVDGIARGDSSVDVELAIGAHTLYVSGFGLTSQRRTLRLDRETSVTLQLAPRPESERPGSVRTAALAATPIAEQALAALARHLGVEAVVVMQLDGDRVMASMAGPDIPLQRAEERGPRSVGIAAVMKKVVTAVGQPCALSHVPPEHGMTGHPLPLELTAGACVDHVSAMFRAGRTGPWLTKSAANEPKQRLELDLAPIRSSEHAVDLEYYLVGHGKNGYDVSGVRDAASPLRISLDADHGRRHWYGKWWIWTIAGVVVGGAVATAVVLTHLPGLDVRLAPSASQ